MSDDSERKDFAPQELRAIQEELSEQRKQCQQLLQRLAAAYEDERARLARDLHDKVAQHLTALLFGLKTLKTASAELPMVREVAKLEDYAEQMGAELHQIAKSMRPTILDDLGLATALTNLINEWSEQTSIGTSIHVGHIDESSLSTDSKIHIYRIIQQSLANVYKHAGATHVSVVLDVHGEELQAIVEDDGAGFDVDSALKFALSRSCLGIIGMRERALLLGGTVEIDSSPGRGTTIILRVPLHAQPTQEHSDE